MIAQIEYPAGNAVATARNVNPELSFTVPEGDLEEFLRLPNDVARGNTVRTDLLQTLRVLEILHTAPNLRAACRAQSALFHGRRGFSPTALRRKLYAYRASGDWRDALDCAKAGARYCNYGAPQGLPVAFIEFLRRLTEENQRGSMGGIREVRRIWKTHADTRGRVYTAIPGYNQWPEADPRTGWPRGWHRGNLAKHVSGKHQLVAARIGKGAARSYLPPVLTSRAGLQVGQYYLFDDHEFNLKINFPGNSRAMRPRGIFGLDLFSGCIFAQLFKPTLWNQEASVKETLKERDAVWAVLNALMTEGYREDTGTVLVLEHGCVAIRGDHTRPIDDPTRDDIEARLWRVSRGKVTIERSGKSGEPAFAGLFEGAVKGNYKFKAAIEVIFSLVDTEFAMLPAQVGLDRNHCPEELAGLERYNNKVLKAALLLPADVAKLLRYPALNWLQFNQVSAAIFHNINTRDDHDLEGWEQCNHVASEWRLNERVDFQPMDTFLALPPAEQQVARALIRANDNLTRARKLSPWEVWQPGRKGLTKLRLALLPQILGPDYGVTRTVRPNQLFEFEDQDMGPGVFRYLARIDGRSLAAGEYLTYLNPFNPAAGLVVCDAAGRVLGVCPPWDANCRADTEAIRRQIGAQRKIEAESLEELGIRHGNRAAEMLALRANNAQVLSGQKLTPRQQEEQRLAARAEAALFGDTDQP